MTLAQIGAEYEASAELLRQRLTQLRREERKNRNAQERWALRQRIETLEGMLTQCNDLARLCTHYYERGFYRDARYTL